MGSEMCIRDRLDLAPGGVCRATAVTCRAGGLLHRPFTLTSIARGGLLSVALSRGSPRVGVTHHRALWSPDFPRRLRAAITRPTRPPTRVRRSADWPCVGVTFVQMSGGA